MENVYALVKRFYGAHGRANIFVPRALVERYLRAAAWKGRSQDDLCIDWYCIEDFLTCITRRSDELARLLIRIDYLALFFRYAENISSGVRSRSMSRITSRGCAPFSSISPKRATTRSTLRTRGGSRGVLHHGAVSSAAPVEWEEVEG